MSALLDALISGGTSALGFGLGGLASKAFNLMLGGGGASANTQLAQQLARENAEMSKQFYKDTSMNAAGEFGAAASASAKTKLGEAGTMYANDYANMIKAQQDADRLRNTGTMTNALFASGERAFGNQADNLVNTLMAMGANPAAVAQSTSALGDVYRGTQGQTFTQALAAHRDSISKAADIMGLASDIGGRSREAYMKQKIEPWLVQPGKTLDSGVFSAAGSTAMGTGEASMGITNVLGPAADLLAKEAGSKQFIRETQRMQGKDVPSVYNIFKTFA